MGMRTTAFDAADTLGWSMAELSRRSGIPVMTLYSIRRGHRSVGPRTIAGLMRAFPHLPFERLFMPADSPSAHRENPSASALAA